MGEQWSAATAPVHRNRCVRVGVKSFAELPRHRTIHTPAHTGMRMQMRRMCVHNRVPVRFLWETGAF
jgi:hypothetical protein